MILRRQRRLGSLLASVLTVKPVKQGLVDWMRRRTGNERLGLAQD
jgi:hypothetical protein